MKKQIRLLEEKFVNTNAFKNLTELSEEVSDMSYVYKHLNTLREIKKDLEKGKFNDVHGEIFYRVGIKEIFSESLDSDKEVVRKGMVNLIEREINYCKEKLEPRIAKCVQCLKNLDNENGENTRVSHENFIDSFGDHPSLKKLEGIRADISKLSRLGRKIERLVRIREQLKNRDEPVDSNGGFSIEKDCGPTKFYYLFKNSLEDKKTIVNEGFVDMINQEIEFINSMIKPLYEQTRKVIDELE